LANYLKERRFIDDKISIDEIANNYALDFVMTKYSANHALTFHSRVKLAQEFSSRHSKLFNTTSSFSVDGTQPTSIRNQILDEFKNSDKAMISNARCLTEGVDVPTIDLVYFSDPKNSKVDIIQAVGRALRKKKGKKLGYIVVPVYHSDNEEVENSISKGSFKNLIQVIRSLCDQDERLQDEINSIAFGKGKRKSKKIDIISSFGEEIDSLHLIGFEDKLRESLFDQIIYKTSNNWDVWFLELKTYLELNNDYPNKTDNKDLYAWVSQQRNRKNNGSLKNEEIRKLNSLNFIWSIVDFKWNKSFNTFKEYSKANVFPPCKGIDSEELVKWYKYQLTCIKESEIISKEQKQKFLEIYNKFQGPSNRKKWIPVFEELVNWRNENSNSWPQQDRENKSNSVNKLANFCQTIRKRYRENDLGNYWLDKMAELDFNFEGKTDNWTQTFEKIESLLVDRKSISINEIGRNEYNWLYRHNRDLEEGKLSDYQSEKVQELNLGRFFETWEQIFEKVKNWTIENGRLPTKTTQKDLHTWLGSQRSVFKKGNLKDNQIEDLKSIEYDLKGKGKEKNEEKWKERLNQYSEFLKINNREPSSYGKGIEKTLYLWAAAQRAVKARSARRRKPLSMEREKALNIINFNWVGQGPGKPWEENFKEFSKFVDNNGKLTLPSFIESELNPVYTWWTNQKVAYKKNKLTEEYIKSFEEIGITLETYKNSRRDGFGKWSNKIREVAEFIEKNGHYPKAGKDKDKEQGNLYQSLARTKRAYKKNELSEEQIELIKELNIDL
jgi:hypothetical protein